MDVKYGRVYTHSDVQEIVEDTLPPGDPTASHTQRKKEVR